MRLRLGFVMVLVIIVLSVGCAPQSKQDGYTVLFDGMVNITDEAIFFRGADVGRVLSSEENGGVTRVTVTLSPDLVTEAGNTIALYAYAGRLEVTRLQRMGQALEKEDLICGFVSKGELNWFKIKTLLNDRISAAKKRVAALQAQLG